MDNYKAKRTKSNNSVPAICVMAFIIIAICVLLFLISGSTTTKGKYPEKQRDTSLKCFIDGLSYPFFRYNESENKTTEINAIFHAEKLDSISIIHTMHYGSRAEVEKSEAHNHASMGIYFAEDNLGSDPFSAHYSKKQNEMSMTLYAKASEINDVASKYFLIDNISINSPIKTYLEMYEAQGFSCFETN